MNYIIRDNILNRVIGIVNAETKLKALNIVETYLTDIKIKDISLEYIASLEKDDMFIFANKSGYTWYKFSEVA